MYVLATCQRPCQRISSNSQSCMRSVNLVSATAGVAGCKAHSFTDFKSTISKLIFELVLIHHEDNSHSKSNFGGLLDDIILAAHGFKLHDNEEQRFELYFKRTFRDGIAH